MPDYLPRTDSEFDLWFTKFLECCLASPDDLGLTRTEAAELQAAMADWGAAFARHRAAREAAREATVLKEKTRVAGEQAIRKYVRIIQARPATTNEQRRRLGIALKPGNVQNKDVLPAIAPPGGDVSLVGY